jgi:hypothetical protein
LLPAVLCLAWPSRWLLLLLLPWPCSCGDFVWPGQEVAVGESIIGLSRTCLTIWGSRRP